MKLKCPNCHVFLPTRQMNVEKDVVICHDCDEAFSISELLGIDSSKVTRNAGWASDADSSLDIDNPPSGVRYDNNGMGWRIASTTRNIGAFFLVPFLVVWSGFSLGGIYGTQIAEGKFELMQSLFGIPFVLGTLVLGTIAMLCVCGRTVIRRDEMDHDAGSIFLGVGPIGWTRRFRWSEITDIDESFSSRGERQHSKQITLYRDDGDIHFGAMLSDKRRRYVLRALRQLVSRR
ncbi:hypothetical protein GC197_14215 [bacterium]|nr:hypothetical protein [bacterium]